MAYIGSSPTKVVSRQSANIFTYTATANQTAFTGADANGNTLACTPSDIMVHMNGIKLEESDYTASTTTVTLGSGAAAGDEVTITAFVTFETADAYTKSASDTRYVNATGDTMSGDLGIGGTATDANWDTATYGNREVAIDGGGGYGVLHFRGDGAGSTNTRYSMGVGDGTFYMAYDDVANVHRINVNSSGHVTKPSQPSFSVRSNAGNSGNMWQQDQVIKFQTVQHNVGSHYSTSTGRFTVPVAGFYVFHYAGFGFNGGQIVANGTVGVALRKNGTNYVMFVYNLIASSTGYPSSTGSVGLYLAASDYVDIYTTGMGQYADASNMYTHWAGYLIG